ncbi:MAG: FeoB small GTPase domain-containing protein [Balneolaceae bacterium]
MSTQNETESFKKRQLKKLGLKFDNWDYMVALAGNPNTGKSTVFNALTGLRQHTGNWPGKTVTRAEGAFDYKKNRFKLVDLPGTYSLLSTSEDEEIARNFILFGQPDVTVIVVDATRLERNLNLTLQILEITSKVIVCLNLMDEAKRRGIEIDIDALSKELGVPVVDTVARYEKGFDKLLASIKAVAEEVTKNESILDIETPDELKVPIEEIVKELEQLYPKVPNKKWLAIRLLEGDERIEESLISGELEGLSKTYNQPHLNLKKELKYLNSVEG